MGIPFIAHTDKSAANTTTKHPHTPNSSQTVTAINGTQPSWEIQILLYPKPVDKCYIIAGDIVGVYDNKFRSNETSMSQ